MSSQDLDITEYLVFACKLNSSPDDFKHIITYDKLYFIERYIFELSNPISLQNKGSFITNRIDTLLKDNIFNKNKERIFFHHVKVQTDLKLLLNAVKNVHGTMSSSIVLAVKPDILFTINNWVKNPRDKISIIQNIELIASYNYDESYALLAMF